MAFPASFRGSSSRADFMGPRSMKLFFALGAAACALALLLLFTLTQQNNTDTATVQEKTIMASFSEADRWGKGEGKKGSRLHLYIPVLNELGFLDDIVRQAAKAIAEEDDSSFPPLPRMVVYIIDNTGCDIRRHDQNNDGDDDDDYQMRAGGAHQVEQGKEEEEQVVAGGEGEPRYSALREELLQSEGLDCNKVLSHLDRLVAAPTAGQHHDPRRLVEVNVIRLPHVTLSFAQSMNFILRHARANNQTHVLFAHSDMTVLGVKIFRILVDFIALMSSSSSSTRENDATAKKKGRSSTPFCFAFTNYDALAIVDVRSIHRFVGDFDERLSYYGDTDFFLRCELAGLPIHHLPFNGLVQHRTLASIGNSERYGGAVRRSVPSWRVYFEKKWGEVFNFRTDYTNFTFAHLSWTLIKSSNKKDNKISASCMSLRRNISALLAAFTSAARPPRQLLIRFVEWEQVAAETDGGADGRDAPLLLAISGVRLYVLPPAVMEEWAEAVHWPRVASAVCADSVDVQQSLFRIP